MPTYFILGKFTPEGIDLLMRKSPGENRPLSIDAAVQDIAADVDVELLGSWITTGAYDALFQIEAPSSLLALSFSLAVGATVGLSTETMAADKGFGDVLSHAGDEAHTRHLGYYGHTRHQDRGEGGGYDDG